MPPRIFAAILLCVILAALAALVLWRDRRSQVNTLFAVFIVTVIGWITSVTLALGASTADETVVFGRWIYAFGSAMPFALLAMFYAFPDGLTGAQRRRLAILAAPCLAAIVASFSPWVVTGASAGGLGANLTYGPLHPVVATYMVLCASAALHGLWRKTRAATGIAQLQFRYLLLGVLLGTLGIVTTNLAIPLVWHSSSFSVLGPYFTLVFASFSAHAILRHRLMDIRVFVGRGIVYATAVAMTGVLVVATVGLVRLLTHHDGRELSVTAALAIALAFALVFEPLRQRLQNGFDRYLYRPPYDSLRTLREVTHRFSTTLQLPAVLSYLTDVVSQTLKPETLTLYLREPGSDHFWGSVLRPQEPPMLASPLPSSSSLVRHLEDTQAPFLGRFDGSVKASTAHDELAIRDAELVLPLRHEQQLSGVLLLGRKRSGDPYFPDDIDFLTMLVSQAGIAVKNAQLYSEVVLAHKHIENIVATIDSGVVVVSATGIVTLFNAAAVRLTGSPAPAVMGKRFDVLAAPLAHVLAGTLADGHPRSNVELELSDDAPIGEVAVLCSTSILRDEAGNRLGAVAVFSDLTTTKQTEADKRRVERLASVSALSAGLAHEIKNPLVAIRTFAELLPERFTDEEFRSTFSAIAVREVDRIDSLIVRLRDLAAPTSPSFRPLDIRKPLDETLSLLWARFERAHVTVKRDYCDDVPPVAGDHDQLKQLFLNLLINALEAIGEYGDVTVAIDHRSSGQWTVVAVKITDTGSGISGAIAGQIFDPFITSKAEGSGLGLSICRGIADAHRATIRLVNRGDGSGASAIVEFTAAVQS